MFPARSLRSLLLAVAATASVASAAAPLAAQSADELRALVEAPRIPGDAGGRVIAEIRERVMRVYAWDAVAEPLRR